MPQVLIRQDARRIPTAGNIMKRWTKAAASHALVQTCPGNTAVHNTEAKQRMLVMKALELANTSEMSALESAKTKASVT